MSTCISRHGEYSAHEPDDDHMCTLCGVLDEDALRAELRALRARGADHDRQVAERALRDAADALPELRDMPPRLSPVERVRAWLRARADSLAPRPAAPGVSVSAERVREALRSHAPIGRAWYNHPTDGPVALGWLHDFLAALGITVTDGGA